VLDVPFQTTLEQGVALDQVTFVAVDLETTGGSPSECGITEIGAVLYRAGERLATFQSLINPRVTIPPFVAQLTGIDDLLVSDAPAIEEVLPSFVEFARGAVFVAHNARFDFSFLNTALERLDYEPLPGPAICTARLAKRVVWPDVPNVRLRTLARYFRTRTEPVHRALADAEACGEVFHGLLDLGGRLGIVTLGDLTEACRARGRPNFGKIRLADALPHAPGVYVFRGRDGRVLYVGKSKDFRARVRSYFYGDERKKVQDLLGDVATVDGVVTPGGELEALALEARLIARHEPPYNRRGKLWRRYAYLKLDPSEAWPRLKVVRAASPDDGCTYVGPFTSSARARLVQEALEEVFPIRRCTKAMGAATRFAPCALADIGRCAAPCDGRVERSAYVAIVSDLLTSVASPTPVLSALEARMSDLAAQERFEEAALVRDRLRALAEALWRARVDAWLTAGRLELRGPANERVVLRQGSVLVGRGDDSPIGPVCPRDRADELAAVRSWVSRAGAVVVGCDPAPAERIEGGLELARILRLLRRAEARRPGRRS